jgi:hypothetical protein
LRIILSWLAVAVVVVVQVAVVEQVVFELTQVLLCQPVLP